MAEKDVKNMHIAIYGAGAMGTVLGALLTKGGLEKVDMITRNEKHVKALRESGATIVCQADDKELNVSVQAMLPMQMTEKYDVIFLMTKQRYNLEILTELTKYLKTDGIICTTQNGLPEPNVAKIIGKERTYGAATSFGASYLDAGKVALTSKMQAMHMEIGGYQNNGEKLPLLEKILSHVGQAGGNTEFVKATENLVGARWSKLTINAAFSGISVMTGMSFGEISHRHKTRKLALGVMRECIAVAKAQDIKMAKMQGHDMEKMLGGEMPIKRFIAYMVLPFAMRKHKKLYSGMLKDVENGRKCEIDYITGLVCQEGAKIGVETPRCAQIVEIVHGIENGLYETDYKNVDFF